MGGKLLAGLILLAAQGAADDGFVSSLPDGVTDVSGWELVSGSFSTARAEGAYRFYVSPGRGALYQVMHYRIRFLAPVSDAERRNRTTEKLVWNAHPGERLPLRCFELTPPGAGPGTPAWREMRHGNQDYNDEMGILIQVLGLQRPVSSDSADNPR